MASDGSTGGAGRGLRVLTWNLHGAARPDVRRVVALLRPLTVDVIALQEVRRGQAAGLAARLGVAAATWTLKHRPFGPLLPATAEGLALLLPGRTDVQSVELTPGTSRWVARRRVAQVAMLPRLGVQVVNTHLDAHDAGRRSEQAGRLVEALDADVPTVLLGDLNARLSEPGVFGRLSAAGLRDAWDAAAGASPASFTSPAHAPVQRIDHVLVSPDVGVQDVRVPPGEWSRHSDHLPVLADLALPATPSSPPPQS